MNKDLIYVSIPSLPDKELYLTIHKCLSMAKKPENIRIGIAYYHDYDSEINPQEIIDSFNNKNIKIKIYDIKDPNNFGVGIGRNDATQFYNKEKYFLQIDSHTNFNKNWDKYLIKLYKKSHKKYGNHVLTACLPKYKRDDLDIDILDECSRYPIYDGFRTHNPDIPKIENCYINTKSKTEYAIKISASMIFSEAHNILNNMIPRWVDFWEEEIIQSIELFSSDVSLIFVQNAPMQHLDFTHIVYGVNDRKHMSQYFSDDFIKQRIESANKNFIKYLNENTEKVKKYEKYSQISFSEKRTHPFGYIPNNKK